MNENTFNLHNSLLNNDDRYIEVIPKSKLIGVAKVANVGLTDYHEFYGLEDTGEF